MLVPALILSAPMFVSVALIICEECWELEVSRVHFISHHFPACSKIAADELRNNHLGGCEEADSPCLLCD